MQRHHGQFHFLIYLWSHVLFTERWLRRQPATPATVPATPHLSPPGLTSSQGGGSLNPVTWGAVSLLRQVSGSSAWNFPAGPEKLGLGVASSRKRTAGT